MQRFWLFADDLTIDRTSVKFIVFMKEKVLVDYEAPYVEVIEVIVEQGFAASMEPEELPGYNNDTWN